MSYQLCKYTLLLNFVRMWEICFRKLQVALEKGPLIRILLFAGAIEREQTAMIGWMMNSS